MAKDKNARPYRKWVLTAKLGLNPEQAEEVLDQGDVAYKQMVRGQ